VASAAVVLIAIIWLIPILGVLITSFRSSSAVAQTGWWTVFSNPFAQTYTLGNYIHILTRNVGGATMGQAFLNSLIITIPATLLPIIIGAFGAFAFAWMKFPLRLPLLALVVGLLSIPLQATIIPILTMYNKIGLTGHFTGIWLVHTGYGLPLVVYFLYSFFKELPHELFDSASIDGATTLQILLRIVFPLSRSALASIAIFQFLWVWNDLFAALMYLGGSPKVAPLTVALSNLVGSRGQGWELLTSAAFISSVVPLLLFFTLQRYFIKGMLAGSIKG